MYQFLIYMISNKQNNCVYIGRTSKTLDQRCKYHKDALKDNKHYNQRLQEDYNKYGCANFVYSEIEYVDTLEQAKDREDYWINYYGGIESTNTYNYQNNKTKNKEHSDKISKNKIGGVAWNKGRKMTPQEIEVNRKSHLGIKRSLESRKKQSATIANNPNFGNKGKHLSESTKQKISDKNKGRPAWNKGKRNTIHKYDSLIPQLKQEYKELCNYADVARLHPDMRYDTIYRLIKYGYLYNMM